jgi:hypothetical protein
MTDKIENFRELDKEDIEAYFDLNQDLNILFKRQTEQS